MVKVKKERLIFSFLLVSTLAAQAQVGVNTVTPKSTLHVLPSTTGSATAEGIIAPNLTRAQLIAKDAKYTDTERGAIVYVTDLSGTLSAKTSKVTQAGYYFFDGSVWQQFASSMPVVSPSPWQVQATTTQATSNTENIYQTGKVAIGTGNNKVSDYNLQVAGTVFVSGDSRVGSSSVVGNETVGGTLGVTGATTLGNALTVGGTTNTKATNITGTLNYKPAGTAPAANTYLRTDASGNASWQALPVVATTEPWQVQGGSTLATVNSQNIYQTGSVGIGSNAAVDAAYKFQVTGASNITGNSRVGSSTVVGNETVGGTLGVTGATTLGNALTVGGTTNTKATNITGTLNYKPTGTAPAANTYLRTDASGNASWQALPVVATTEPWQVQGGSTLATTNSQNIYQAGSVGIGSNAAVDAAYKFQVSGASNITGNSRVGSSTVAGNETVGGTLGVTGATTLGNALTVGGTTTLNSTTNAKATNITGTLNYKPTGTAPAANTYLRTDASGNASWQALPVVATTEPWQVQGGSTLATSNSQNIYQTGSVGIGSNAGVNAAYKFQVSGASNITGNSRVASSTVVGAQTIGTTLSVTTTSTLTGKVGIGRAPAAGNYALAMQGNSYQSGNGYVSGSIKMGGDETFNTSAQLELKDANKGFLPNRVALTSASLKAPITNAVDGIIVYNTATVGDLSPGLYYWKQDSWNRLVDNIPQSTLFIRDLQQNCISLPNDANNTAKGALMNFGTLTIPEDGSYSFTFRLYGRLVDNQTAMATQIYYIGLLVNNNTLKDTAEMDILTAPGSQVMTYSITLGAQFKAGDVVSFRLSNAGRSTRWNLSSRPGSLGADRTSLVWSKL